MEKMLMKLQCPLFRFQFLTKNAMNSFQLLLFVDDDDNDVKRRISYFSYYLFFLLLIIFPKGISSSVTDSEALLQLKKSFTNAAALDSWKPNTDACDVINRWKGVVCNHEGGVANLNLANNNLSGTVDVDALVQIPGLRGLSLMYNLFSGPIPQLNRLGYLKSIYLVGNNFSGEIPADYFKRMLSLKKIWLSDNKFSGGIPSSLTRLPLLIELHLENNKFTGEIPEFRQPRLRSFNVSNNNLTGEVPHYLYSFNSSSFGGNPELCGQKVDKHCKVFHKKDNVSRRSFTTYFFLLLIISVVILALMSLGIYVLYSRQKRESYEQKMSNCPNRLTSLRDLTPSKNRYGGNDSTHATTSSPDLVMVSNHRGEFSLTDLMSAAAETLTNGTMGAVYKATMSNGLTVIVKRIRGLDKLGKDGFYSHMARLGRLKHRNILSTLACYYQKEEKLLVTEYFPRGSLLYLLHGDRGAAHDELNWATRVKIIKGIAQGIKYLHAELASPIDVPHGDLKSSNVILDSNYEPLLTDFGFSFLMPINQCEESQIAYRSPEAVAKTGVSPKSDVYCLGILILELFTGKIPSLYVSKGTGEIDVVEWVKSAIAEGREAELIDPDIETALNTSPGNPEKFLRIGVDCTETDPHQRMDIIEAINRIEAIQIDGSDQGTTQSNQEELVSTAAGSNNIEAR